MSIKIKHLTPLVQVFNMPRSLAFYRDILGFEIVMDSGNGDSSGWVWIKKDGCHLMLNDQYEVGHEPEAPPAERVRWHKTRDYSLAAKMSILFTSILPKKVSRFSRRS